MKHFYDSVSVKDFDSAASIFCVKDVTSPDGDFIAPIVCVTEVTSVIIICAILNAISSSSCKNKKDGV